MKKVITVPKTMQYKQTTQFANGDIYQFHIITLNIAYIFSCVILIAVPKKATHISDAPNVNVNFLIRLNKACGTYYSLYIITKMPAKYIIT